MWSEAQEFPSSEQHIVSQQPTQPLVDQVVESDPDVIEPMSHLVNTTLPSESDFHDVVESISI